MGIVAVSLSGLVIAIGTLQPLSFYVVSLSGYGDVSIEICFLAFFSAGESLT